MCKLNSGHPLRVSREKKEFKISGASGIWVRLWNIKFLQWVIKLF